MSRHARLLACLFLAATAAAQDQVLLDGRWHAWLDCPGGDLPFDLQFASKKGKLRAAVINGEERIEVPVVRFTKQLALTLEFDYYDSRIEAYLTVGGQYLRGEWKKRRGGTKQSTMRFHAKREERPRFVRIDSGEPAGFAGRYHVQFAKDKHPSVGVFHHAGGNRVHGTFLTALGDYRYLAGNRHGTRLALSCFDGAHAFLFVANRKKDGTLAGDFWSSDTWHEKWTAKPDADAALPDAWKLTKADSSQLGRLRFPGLDGKPRSLNDPAFAGKARILVVFGSWCPNCKDASAYLAELHRRYQKRGLSVVGLAFEHSGDLARDTKQLKIYARRQGIGYPILLAGLSDKKKASQALPLLDRVRSYPTTIFLRGDDSLHSVYTGFSGPGTGAAYEKLRKRFESIVEELLR